jgi:hypothetical protein
MKCPQCGSSSRFRRDGTSGFLYCRNGHQQAIQTREEVGEEMIVSGARRRRLKSLNKRRSTQESHIASKQRRLLPSNDHLFEIFQFGLKNLAKALIEKCDFPSQFEVIYKAHEFSLSNRSLCN